MTTSLSKLAGDMAHVMRGLEIAAELTQDIYGAYQRAPYSVKPVLVNAFIDRVVVRDGQIVSAAPKVPLDYACFSNLKGNSLFNLAYVGGDKRSLTEYTKILQQQINPYTLETLGRAYRLLQSLKTAA